VLRIDENPKLKVPFIAQFCAISGVFILSVETILPALSLWRPLSQGL
jgi:hypothetical protein